MNEQLVDDHGSVFEDLVSYKKVTTKQRRVKGNIIKSAQAELTGRHRVEVETGDAKKPSVIMHRNGDTLEKIECVCSCGKTTMIDFEYEEE
jgi:hypothetical protein